MNLSVLSNLVGWLLAASITISFGVTVSDDQNDDKLERGSGRFQQYLELVTH